KRGAGQRLADALDLVENAPGADYRHPELGRALALTHAGLGGLLADGLVREDPDVELPTALDGTVDGDTRGLDLPGGEPSRGRGLEPEVPEGDRVSALGAALHAALLDLAVLDSGWREH